MARYQIRDEQGRKINVIEWDGKTPLNLPAGQTATPDDGTPIWTPPVEKPDAIKLIDQLESDGVLTAARATRARAAVRALKFES